MPDVRDAEVVAVTSSTAVPIPRPDVEDGDWVYLFTPWRGTITASAVPAGFDPVASTTGLSGGATAGNVRLLTYRKFLDVGDAASEPATYDFTGSGNVFGIGGSVSVPGAATDEPIDIATLLPDTDNNGTVLSPSVTTTKPNTLLLRGAFMNNPSAGFALNDFTPAEPATRLWSPAMPAGTSRVSGGLAWEPGPASPGATGTLAWTVGGSVFGPALAFTIAITGPTLNAVAGDDITVTPGTLVQVDGNATVGADTLEWTQLTGPSVMTYSQQADGVLTFIAPEGPAEIVLQLTATAGEAVGLDQKTVTVTGSQAGFGLGYLGSDLRGVF